MKKTQLLTGTFAIVSIATLHIACIAEPAQVEPLGDPSTTEPETTTKKADQGDDKEEKDGSKKKTEEKKDDKAPAGGGGKCPHEGPLLDVSGFEKCSDGGRCVPTNFIPEKERGRLAECPDGLCVPEKIIANEGNLLPKSCASIAGAEGRCLSIVFPDLNAQKDQLPQDVCDANERCAPCFDPTSGADTGACSSVSCDAPKKPKVIFKDCCSEGGGAPRGKCIPEAQVPEKDRGGLDIKECDQAFLCAPVEQVNQAPAVKCTGSAFVLGDYAGVCISTCVHQGFLTSVGTSQGDCKDGFFCAPCANPLTGEPTGAPGCT